MSQRLVKVTVLQRTQIGVVREPGDVVDYGEADLAAHLDYCKLHDIQPVVAPVVEDEPRGQQKNAATRGRPQKNAPQAHDNDPAG